VCAAYTYTLLRAGAGVPHFNSNQVGLIYSHILIYVYIFVSVCLCRCACVAYTHALGHADAGISSCNSEQFL